MLRIFEVSSPARIALSDDVCIALQIIEHLQDVGEDAARDRIYLPQSDLRALECAEADLRAARTSPPLADRPALRSESGPSPPRLRRPIDAPAPAAAPHGGVRIRGGRNGCPRCDRGCQLRGVGPVVSAPPAAPRRASRRRTGFVGIVEEVGVNTETAYRACEEITRREAKNFGYGIRLLRVPERHALSSVYALARKIDDIGDGIGAAGAEAHRARAGAGEPAPDRRHDGHGGDDPVLVAVAAATIRYQLPLGAFDELIEGCENDVRGTSYATFDDLVVYCRLVAGSIGRLSLAVFGATDPTAVELADDLGVALQLTNILRDVVEDRSNGRVYLPAEDAIAVGCPPDLSGGRCRSGGAGRLRVRTSTRVVRTRIAAAPTVRSSEPGLRRGHGRHLLPLTRAHRTRSPRRDPTVGSPCRRPKRCGSPAKPRRGTAVTAHRVVVVGGGLAGVSAALSLADAGAQVTLLERRLRLGGLTWSFQRNGLSFDNGQHVFLRCCTAYLRFLDRIGAREAVYLQPRLDIPVLSPDGTRASITAVLVACSPSPRFVAGPLSAPDSGGAAAPGVARLGLEPPQSRGSLARHETFGSWLSQHGQSDVAIDRLWDLITLPTLNVHASEASLALAVKVFRTGLLDQADAGDVGWSTVPLTELHGDYAARALESAGVETVVGVRVQHVVERGDRGLEVVTDEHRHRADAVIVTTPPEVTQRVLPEGVLPTNSGSASLPLSTCIWYWIDRSRISPLAAVVNSPIQFFFDRTSSSGLRSGQCISISLSAADDYIGESSSQLVGTFFAALQALLPIARTARLVDGVVTRERAATFRGNPGTAARRPSTRTTVPGLFLAGAWCDTGWPATMEGAVLSGESAARAILEDTEQAKHQLQGVAM